MYDLLSSSCVVSIRDVACAPVSVRLFYTLLHQQFVLLLLFFIVSWEICVLSFSWILFCRFVSHTLIQIEHLTGWKYADTPNKERRIGIGVYFIPFV